MTSATNQRSIALEGLEFADQYKLMHGLIVPRPIAWISTIGPNGANLAPFSLFNIVSIDPCMVMFCVNEAVGRRKGTMKDTVENITANGEMVIHLVEEKLLPAMNLTSGEHPAEVNEFALAGLTETPSQMVRPPRIAEAQVALECRLSAQHDIGRVPFKMFIAEVLMMHLPNDMVNARYHIDPNLHQPVARLGAPALYIRARDQVQLDFQE